MGSKECMAVPTVHTGATRRPSARHEYMGVVAEGFSELAVSDASEPRAWVGLKIRFAHNSGRRCRETDGEVAGMYV